MDFMGLYVDFMGLQGDLMPFQGDLGKEIKVRKGRREEIKR